MTEETTELRVEPRHWSRARDWWNNKKGFGGDHLRQLAEAFARFERDLTRPAAIDAGVERLEDAVRQAFIEGAEWQKQGRQGRFSDAVLKCIAALTRPQAVDGVGECRRCRGKRIVPDAKTFRDYPEDRPCPDCTDGTWADVPRHTAQSRTDQTASVAPERGR